MKYLVTGSKTCEWGSGKGIEIFEITNHEKLPMEAPVFKHLSTTEELSPTFLTVSNDHNVIYTCNETNDSSSVGLSAFKLLNWASGQLKKVGTFNTDGTSACFAQQVDRTLLLSNYMSGSWCAFKLDAKSVPTERTFYKQFEHHSNVDPTRQEGPHAHCAEYHAASKQVFVADLGADRIYKYNLDAANATVTSHSTQPFLECQPGCGPRHISMHPNGKYMYLSCELSNEVRHFEIDSKGCATFVSCLSTLIESVPVQTTNHPQNMSHILCSKDGKFVFAANRGPMSSIASYTVDQSTGRLTHVGNYATVGTVPRHFTIDDTGTALTKNFHEMKELSKEFQWMLVAMQEGHNICSYRIESDGKLVLLGHHSTQSPQCVSIVEV